MVIDARETRSPYSSRERRVRIQGRSGGPSDVSNSAPHIQLLNSFELSVDGHVCPLPTHAQRVLAFLALQGRRQARTALAERLWLEMPTQRSQANLRTALWRIRRAGSNVVSTDHASVCLLPDVAVDVELAITQSKRLLSNTEMVDSNADLNVLRGELLPSWDEDWITLERERMRQLRLHALEALCHRLTVLHRYAEAIEAGQEAVAGEPLRESAQTVLIRAYLSEGNTVEAMRQFVRYDSLVRDELGVAPSEELRALVERTLDAVPRRHALRSNS
jgi:DNA-binding SARP family transcriptional activator